MSHNRSRPGMNSGSKGKPNAINRVEWALMNPIYRVLPSLAWGLVLCEDSSPGGLGKNALPMHPETLFTV